MSDEIDVSVLNRKCGLIWFASACDARRHEQLLLFLQPVLDARAVPDLDRDRHAQTTVGKDDEAEEPRRDRRHVVEDVRPSAGRAPDAGARG